MPGTIQDLIKNQSVYTHLKPKKLKFDILPDLYLGIMSDEHFCHYGTDTLQWVIKNSSEAHYKNYPDNITYNFNNRGFRDNSWPSDLQNNVWCVGDSHTMGIGVKEEDMFCNLIKNTYKLNVVNISFYAANNIWLSCAAVDILKEINPKYLVIGWTHFDKVIAPYEETTDKIESLIFFRKCVDRVYKANKNTKIIHFIVPNSTKHIIPDTSYKNFFGVIESIDKGRDNFHIGPKTHNWLANKIGELLC